MVALAANRLISVEEYLEGEMVSDVRHEYVAGQVFAMTGASEPHNRINVNLAFHLRAAARGTPCGVFINDMKIRVPLQEAFYYPDVAVSCEGYDAKGYVKLAPCLVAEVLSPSTEAIDRREKLLGYRGLPSLRYYLMIAQDQPLVECYSRAPDQSWQHRRLTRMEEEFTIDCPPLTQTLRLADLYEDVRLPAAAERPAD